MLLVVIACHEQLSKEITHTIITAPKNVIDNWKKEAERYLDGLRVDKLRSKDFFVMDGSSLKPILDWAKAPKGILVIGHVMLAKKVPPDCNLVASLRRFACKLRFFRPAS